ncbi:purine phosphorylase [Phaeovibrio sulfidiphilus]|uniref:Purine phosphorylase n=1 Tax=Phaeovibrio sulfidiphilus TaxID=1220600 RepID=A0A8J6YLM0_9PROT|nr:purine phosphorylase [Phaeovibrio sulfidiphilus]MBE1237030.1 purine phosphorylase [Phaeovibrio sulfidiphilus]
MSSLFFRDWRRLPVQSGVRPAYPTGEVMIPGFVCGLEREAALLPAGSRVLCLGPGPRKAKKAAHRLLVKGCDALVSFGTAAGLAPGLAPGTLLLPERIVWQGGEAETDPRLLESLLPPELRERAERGILYGVDEPLFGPSDKNSLFESSRAVAADMESHAIAVEAQACAVPFCVIRAVADPAGRSVPPWIMGGVDKHGRTRVMPLLKALAVSPPRVAPVIRLARDAFAAEKTLRTALAGSRQG